jgi:hypothetical protein
MRPTIIPDHTRKMTPPKDWDQSKGAIGTLYVRDELDAGIQRMRSAWEPEGNEAGWLIAGGHLHVSIAGHTHPVIALAAQLPPEDSPVMITAQPIVKEVGGKPAVRVEMYFPATSDPVAIAKHGWAEIDLEGISLAEATASGILAIQSMVAAQGRDLPHNEQSG